ncbi:MAG: OmpA family protein [Chlamydiales bacterium]
MKKQTLLMIGVALLSVVASSCNRTSRVMWEDTKTCGHYMGKGFRSFFGQHIDTNDYGFYKTWHQEEEFTPLCEDEGYVANFSMQDYIPASKEAPGDPGSPIPGIDGFFTPSGHLAELFANIHFGLDNYTIQGEENIRVLRQIADYLEKHPNIYLFVEGHADERGAAAYNLALGSRRANSVRTFLIQEGVNPDQLFTISYGKERPLVRGHDEATWQQNRRSQFKLYDR